MLVGLCLVVVVVVVVIALFAAAAGQTSQAGIGGIFKTAAVRTVRVCVAC